MRSRILLGTIFGALGGFVGFLLQESAIPHDAVLSMTAGNAARLGIFLGSMLGIAIGSVEGASTSSPRVLLRGAILGAVIGGIGGIMGVMFGGIVYQMALFGKDPNALVGNGNILDFTHQVLARALGWTLLGGIPGLAAGAATLSPKRAMHGLAGGLIGGFVGGVVFDLAATLVTQPIQATASFSTGGPRTIEIGGPSRGIGFTAIGAFTGLFIGLVEAYLKQAWVRVLAGRNEGKDYIISKAMTVLGRDERADVPLFGDPNLAPQHAAIKMENGRHILLDGGAPLGAVVNGQRIQQQLLKDGDMIQLGQMRLLFREKATAAKIGRPAPDMPKNAQAPGAVAMPSHLCPFCGAQKDAQGNCLCSVPGAGAPPPIPSNTGYLPPDPYQSAGPAGYGAPGYEPVPDPYGGGAYPPYSNSGPGSQLLCIEGPYAGQTFPLQPQDTTLGRDAGKDIPLVNDVTVSRNHGRIAMEGGGHVVYDDGSSNGTFVNNVRITIQALAPGDIVQFGTSKFRYE